MKKGFIFDLDGVIVDTAKYHYLAWKKLANELGFVFTEEQNEMFKGVSRKRCLEILLDIGNRKATQKQFDTWMIKKNEDYLEYIANMDTSEILPDVPRILNFLAQRNLPIALGSASKNALIILEKLQITSFFEAIIDGNSVQHGKPHPEVFLKGSNALGVAAEACVVFEDSQAGIDAAKAGGMTAVALGDAELFENMDYCYPDFEALDEVVLQTLF